MKPSLARDIFFKPLRAAQMNYFFQRRKPNQLYILTFHRINNHRDIFYPAVPVPVFRQICAFFCASGLEPLYFSEAGAHFKQTDKPAFIISFDDGYYELLQYAYPILKEYKLKFNLNMPTQPLETRLPPYNVIAYDVLNITEKKEYVCGGILPRPVRIKIDRSRPQRTEAEFRELFRGLTGEQSRLIADNMIEKLTGGLTEASRMLSKEDLVFLNRNGAEIGSHTHSHALLAGLGPAEVEFELSHSKKILEDLCGRKVDIIAFPRGLADEAVIAAARAIGYKYLLLTGDRSNPAGNKEEGLFYRFGLYYRTLDEALAKVFGFHQSICGFKKRCAAFAER